MATTISNDYIKVSVLTFKSHRMHHTVDGIKFASNFGEKIGTRFSQVFGIICISGGYQDLLPGFYQVFTLISVGISRIQRGKPIRNL